MTNYNPGSPDDAIPDEFTVSDSAAADYERQWRGHGLGGRTVEEEARHQEDWKIAMGLVLPLDNAGRPRFFDLDRLGKPGEYALVWDKPVWSGIPDPVWQFIHVNISNVAKTAQDRWTCDFEVWTHTGPEGQNVQSLLWRLAFPIGAERSYASLADALESAAQFTRRHKMHPGWETSYWQSIALELDRKLVNIVKGLNSASYLDDLFDFTQPIPLPLDWYVQGIIPGEGVGILAGQPGTAKSMTATAITLAATYNRPVAGLTAPTSRVLYLDWESSWGSFANRMRGMAYGHNLSDPANSPVPDVDYKRLEGPLVDNIPMLKELIADRQPDLVIVDSLSRAVSNPLDHAEATEVMEFLISLRIPALAIAHIPKNQRANTVYGAQAFTAAARSVTFAKEEGRNGGNLEISFTAGKQNDMAYTQPWSITWSFEGSIVFSNSPGLQDPPPTPEEMLLDFLDEGPATKYDIIESMGKSDRAVSTLLSDLARKGLIAKTGKRGRADLWAKIGGEY